MQKQENDSTRHAGIPIPRRSLYQRGGVWHIRLTLNGRTVRRSLKTREKSLARRAADALLYEVVKARVLGDLGLAPVVNGFRGCPTRHELPSPKGAIATEKPLSLAVITQDMGALWATYETWARVHVRPRTIERYKLAWEHFTRFLNGREIDAEAVGAFKARLVKDGYAAKSINGFMGDLRAILNRLQRLGHWQGGNPAANVDMLKTARTPPRVLTQKETKTLLKMAQAHSPDMFLFVALGLFAGLRKGEIVACRWEWLDWQARVLTVQAGHGFIPKSRDCRTIPISDALARILRPLRREGGYLLSPDKAPGRDRYRIEVRHHFEAVATAAGVGGWVTPHNLRHSFASALVRAGVSLFKVQTWLGHTDPQTTMIYAHMSGHDADINGKK